MVLKIFNHLDFTRTPSETGREWIILTLLNGRFEVKQMAKGAPNINISTYSISLSSDN